ncbi:hypothetical protein H5410_012293 [Solanum commersonii]|uniref:Uncharacterized protein n=1 Tax=Solanum commersonii TaxID=4109 RepID=A0A9J6AS02_SOLCO|nr:hypothetical protein H5410_012293 [Solanum commersonii]
MKEKYMMILTHIDIDSKIQTVLGGCIKDFEGAVSAENLGPKYGVYGLFLPIDQIVIQPHISQILPSSSHKPIRIKLRSGNTAAPKSSDLHTASDKTQCPEQTTCGDESSVAPFIIHGDWIRCSTCRSEAEASPVWYKTRSTVSELALHYVRLASWHELSEDDTTTALPNSHPK